MSEMQAIKPNSVIQKLLENSEVIDVNINGNSLECLALLTFVVCMQVHLKPVRF